jgi:hypothetical protein
VKKSAFFPTRTRAAARIRKYFDQSRRLSG